jgi:hypothetical protein
MPANGGHFRLLRGILPPPSPRFPVLALSFAPRCVVSEPSPITYSPRNPASRLVKGLHWGGGNPPPHRLPCFSHS